MSKLETVKRLDSTAQQRETVQSVAQLQKAIEAIQPAQQINTILNEVAQQVKPIVIATDALTTEMKLTNNAMKQTIQALPRQLKQIEDQTTEFTKTAAEQAQAIVDLIEIMREESKKTRQKQSIVPFILTAISSSTLTTLSLILYLKLLY